MGLGSEHTVPKGRNKYGLEISDMFIVPSNQGNANQNSLEILSFLVRTAKLAKQQPNAGGDWWWD